MEFMSRGTRPDAPAAAAAHTGGRKKHIDWVSKTVRFELFVVIVGSALLLAAVALWLGTGNFNNAESKQISTNEYQAVFLTNSQVYFGKITTLNNKFVVLNDVFYIESPNQSTTTPTTANTNYTLRKLGVTELHAPEDKMVINRDQVSFWENLKDSGQVVTKIKEYKKNPDAANQQTTTGTGQQSTSPSQTTTKP